MICPRHGQGRDMAKVMYTEMPSAQKEHIERVWAEIEELNKQERERTGFPTELDIERMYWMAELDE